MRRKLFDSHLCTGPVTAVVGEVRLTESTASQIIAAASLYPGVGRQHAHATFWECAWNSGNTPRMVPFERWDADMYYHPVPGQSTSMYARHAAWLTDVERFDAVLFRCASVVDDRMHQHKTCATMCGQGNSCWGDVIACNPTWLRAA